MSKKFIVTGVAGFIGSHITERLIKDGNQVIGVDCFTDYYCIKIKEKNLENLLTFDSFNLIKEDLLRINFDEVLEGVSGIFHEAAQAGVRASWGADFKIYCDNNILATQRLLEAIKNKGVRLIYASSSSVYGDTKKIPMEENDKPLPISPYGVTKLAAEHLCSLYHKNFGMDVISLRYFTVYGPRQRPDMAFHKLIKAALTDSEFVIYGDGSQTRDFTYINDVVEANMGAFQKGKSGEVYNIGGGHRIDMNSVIETISEIIGKNIKVKRIEKQKGDVQDTFSCTDKANKDFNYKPMFSLEEGLEKEIKWIRDNFNSPSIL
jgi:UDP-glucose 4-epimerase